MIEDRVFREKLETVSSETESSLCFAFRYHFGGSSAACFGRETLNPARRQQEVEA
jgi:hypothetical protein